MRRLVNGILFKSAYDGEERRESKSHYKQVGNMERRRTHSSPQQQQINTSKIAGRKNPEAQESEPVTQKPAVNQPTEASWIHSVNKNPDDFD